MPIEHFGLGVSDVDAAKAYYDQFMPLVPGSAHSGGSGKIGNL